MSIDRRMGLMALAALPGLGPVRIRKLDEVMGGKVERLLEMDDRDRAKWCDPGIREELEHWRGYFDPEKVEAELRRMEADFLTSEEGHFPQRLAPYSDRPVGLYRYRAGTDLGERVIAIVGTRRPTAYGRRVAREFAGGLARAGFTIISGMAEGIDSEAHRSVLEAGGKTAAVLGGGLKRCYPVSNRELMEEIARSAGVWTEFPLWRNADRRSFPQRNRIVSGLSEAVIVVESGVKGGSLITAGMASEQGKPVYVIPGRIDMPESAGCHALARDGAQLVTSVEEVLEDVNYLPFGLQQVRSAGIPPIQGPDGPELEGSEALVWQFLGKQGKAHLDAISLELDLPVPQVSSLVLKMEIAGHLARRLDGCFERA